MLIPRFAGDIYIPQIQFNYFDPTQAKWLTQSTTRHRLKVSPNEKAAISSIGLTKEEITLVGKDIRFIDESQPKWQDQKQWIGYRNHTVIPSSIRGNFCISSCHNFTRKKLDQSFGGWQARRALKTAFSILDSASDTPEAIYTHIYKAVISFINHKTGSK